MDDPREATDRIEARSTIAEGSAERIDLDECSDDHQTSGEEGGEANTHLVEDDPCEDEEAYKDIEEELTSSVKPEDRRVPS